MAATNPATASNMIVIRLATSTILIKPHILQRPEGGRRCRWKNPFEGDLRHGTGSVSSRTLFHRPGRPKKTRGRGRIVDRPRAGPRLRSDPGVSRPSFRWSVGGRTDTPAAGLTCPRFSYQILC